jgi:hypothetical protein
MIADRMAIVAAVSLNASFVWKFTVTISATVFLVADEDSESGHLKETRLQVLGR